MPNWCCVAACQNSSRKTDKSGKNLRFFRFPPDPKIQKQWVAACRRKDEFNPSHSRMCSEHFTNEDYEDELQARLMGTVPVRLKKTGTAVRHQQHQAAGVANDALLCLCEMHLIVNCCQIYCATVPTLNLSYVPKGRKPKSASEDAKIKERKKLVEALLKESDSTPGESSESSPFLTHQSLLTPQPSPYLTHHSLSTPQPSPTPYKMEEAETDQKYEAHHSHESLETHETHENHETHETHQGYETHQTNDAHQSQENHQTSDSDAPQPVPQFMVESILEAPEMAHDESVKIEVDKDALLRKVEELEGENETLLQMNKEKVIENETLLKKIAALEQKLAQFEGRSASQNKKIHALEHERSGDSKHFDKKVKELFKDCLSPNQIDIMLKRKSKARWTQEEFSKAFTLRYLSQRSYAYVKDTLNYPLPGLSTLRKWASLSQLKSGVLDDVFRIMEISGQAKTPLQRCTVLSFSEMKVASVFEYNDKEDDIIGPHNYMQVIMAQGLADDWKQPVYIEFDKKITKEILLSIITKLDKISFEVVACTCNCSGVNQGIWKDFGITMDNTFILHPVTHRKIHFFADAPHLLKLLRNWFLDTGFLLQGALLSKDPVATLISIPSDEISLRPTSILSIQHIMCDEAQRHNFKLAKELFSHTTAIGLKRLLHGDIETNQRTGDFVSLVNNWYDLMTTRDTNAEIPTKKPYGLQRDVQFATLERMVITMKNMIRVGKNNLQMFQKAIIFSCKSLEELYKDMKDRHQINYIPTHRLSQECLEKFCAQLRSGYVLHEHPTPKTVISRLRKILLGKGPGPKRASHANSAEEIVEEYLITDALKQANIDVPIEVSTLNEEVNTMEPLEDIPMETAAPLVVANPMERSRDNEVIDIVSLARNLAEKYLGKQVQPSEQWLDQVKAMEFYFVEFHCQNITDGSDIFIRTCEYILQKLASLSSTNLDPKLVEYYVSLRLPLRINFLNNRHMDDGILKRRLMAEESAENAKRMRAAMNYECHGALT